MTDKTPMQHRFFSLILTVCFSFTSTLAFAANFENILFIGDSHSYGNFGKSLDTYLRTLGTNVTSIASCGSSPSNWMSVGSGYQKTVCGYWRKDPSGKETRVKNHNISPLPEELQKTQADLTVIALGTNILSSPSNIAREKAIAEKMLQKVQASSSRCVWVGPPDAAKEPFKKNLAQGIKELRETAEKYNCLFIDSTQFTKYPAGTSDGIHYGGKDSTFWGTKVSESIAKNIEKLGKTKPAPVGKSSATPRGGGVR